MSLMRAIARINGMLENTIDNAITFCKNNDRKTSIIYSKKWIK